eukprot:1152261-Pelagomonas_calceolata.AAC.1
MKVTGDGHASCPGDCSTSEPVTQQLPSTQISLLCIMKASYAVLKHVCSLAGYRGQACGHAEAVSNSHDLYAPIASTHFTRLIHCFCSSAGWWAC